MAKNFFKHHAHSGRDDGGCMSGLISIFDFRVNNYSHRLLSHRKCGTNKHLETECSRRKLDFPSALDIILEDIDGSLHKDSDKNKIKGTTSCMLSVKKLMEEEMFNPNNPYELEKSQSLPALREHERKKKKINKNHYTTLDKRNFDLELPSILDSLDADFHTFENHVALKTAFSVVTKMLKNQKIADPRALTLSEAFHSKEFLDALEMLSSNKELILKLIQDPNSLLLKHIQDIQEIFSSFSKENDKFEGKNNSQETNKILIFQSSPLNNESVTQTMSFSPLSHHSLKRGKGEKTKSYFSFKGIKRKLRRVIGKNRKEQHLISMDGVLDKIPCGHKDSNDARISDLVSDSEYKVVSPRFSPLRQHSVSDAKIQVIDTNQECIFEGLEPKGIVEIAEASDIHDNLDVVEVCEEEGPLAVPELMASDGKPELNTPSAISPEFLHVEKSEFTHRATEHTSPVSVLDPFFLDDVTSPESLTSVGLPIHAHKIDFQEQENSEVTLASSSFEGRLMTCLNEKEAVYDFITTLLQASNSSNQFVNPSIFEEASIMHNLSQNDSKLLFDCTNEVTKEIETRSSYYTLWISFRKPSFSHQNFIKEVCKGIDKYLQLSHYTIDEIDMIEMKGKSWVNHRLEMEDIVTEMADGIAEEIIEEITSKN